MSDMRKNQYFVPGDGIARAVIQADICKYLDNDATVRPGEFNGNQGYFIFAYRNLTDAMIEDLKNDSKKWRNEQEEKDRMRGRKDRMPRNLPPNTYENSSVHARRQKQPDYPIDLNEPSPFGGPIDVTMGNTGNPGQYQRSSPYSGSDQGQYTTSQSMQQSRYTPPTQPGVSNFQQPYDSFNPAMQSSNMPSDNFAQPRSYQQGGNGFGNFAGNGPNGAYTDLTNANAFPNQPIQQTQQNLSAINRVAYSQAPPAPVLSATPQRDKAYGSSAYESTAQVPNAYKKTRMDPSSSSSSSRPDYRSQGGGSNNRFR